MSQPAIKVQGISKEYIIGRQQKGQETFREMVVGAMAAPFQRLRKMRGDVEPEERFWALKDINFEVQPGEVVGIIGRNGSGKSTLLKILSHIIEPTCGQVRLRGRVSSLLEVGTGFHPELTGRENIFLNGAILGMRRGEIRGKFDEIVAFAEVGEFVDTPVKHYSSGMYVRLAFAVAAQLEPDILVIDEVLAVGDAQFQRKCLARIGEVSRDEGKTVLFVSHNMSAIARLCSRVVVLDKGRIAIDGPPIESVASYSQEVIEQGRWSISERTDRSGSGVVRFASLNIRSEGHATGSNILVSGSGAAFEITLSASASNNVGRIAVAIILCDLQLQPLLTLCTRFLDKDFSALAARVTVRCDVPKFPVGEGKYVLNLWCSVDELESDVLESAQGITVIGGDFFGTGRVTKPEKHGPLLAHHDWTVVNHSH